MCWVEFPDPLYNKTRLHSAIGYVTPGDELAGREAAIFAARGEKPAVTRRRRAASASRDFGRWRTNESAARPCAHLIEGSFHMSVPGLVHQFYERIWNAGELEAIPELLATGIVFRGSLGNELRGHQAFADYVRSVRGCLSDYRCEILDCVAESDQAFAKMRFSGLHMGVLRGYPPTDRPVQWLGAALFRFDRALITELWVLGDLAGLEQNLQRNAGN